MLVPIPNIEFARRLKHHAGKFLFHPQSRLYHISSPPALQVRYGEMVNPSSKRQKRQDYRNSLREGGLAELPKKKFYRQRAHANPFSDHALI